MYIYIKSLYDESLQTCRFVNLSIDSLSFFGNSVRLIYVSLLVGKILRHNFGLLINFIV